LAHRQTCHYTAAPSLPCRALPFCAGLALLHTVAPPRLPSCLGLRTLVTPGCKTVNCVSYAALDVHAAVVPPLDKWRAALACPAATDLGYLAARLGPCAAQLPVASHVRLVVARVLGPPTNLTLHLRALTTLPRAAPLRRPSTIARSGAASPT
jgi:hypothetical protein